jgi:hypothetical protein
MQSWQLRVTLSLVGSVMRLEQNLDMVMIRGPQGHPGQEITDFEIMLDLTFLA